MSKLKELKELSFNENHILLKDNIVKGSILPEKASELCRNITIQKDTEIEGAVYSYKLEIQQGNAVFHGPIFTQLELFINSDATGDIVFHKSVGSANSVVSRAIKSNLSFYSDINAKKVTLYNAFVAGSIYADEVTLQNCVVIGGVFSTQNAEINNCVVGTFNCPTIKASDQIFMLLPSAFSIEKILTGPGTKFFNLSLADLGSLFKSNPQSTNSGKIEMNIETDEIKTVLTNNETQKTLRSYSIVGKVLAADLLDLNKFQNHFLLTSASLGAQLLNNYDLGVNSKGETVTLTIDKIRAFFFDILNGKIGIQEIDGKFSLSEIAEKLI